MDIGFLLRTQINNLMPTKPGFYQHIKHAYLGYDVFAGKSTDLDELGLEFVRTLHFCHYKTHIEFRIVHPDDLHQIVGEYPTEKQVRSWYCYPGAVV